MAVLLFTDMVDSVAVERRSGTEAYSRLLKQHHQLFREALKSVPGGELLNDTGDGILSEFHTAAGAVNAALLFQMLLRDAKWEQEAPRVRVGIHQGQLAEFQMDPAVPGKVVGMPVNIAARVMSLAQAGQILMTRPVYDDARQFVREHPTSRPAAGATPSLRWKAHGSYTFKGSEDSVEIFEVGAAGFAPMKAPPNTEKAQSTALPRSASSVVAVRKRSPVAGAAVTVACGLVLWLTTLGESWVTASYDTLFRFSTRTVTNQVAVILMDNPAFSELSQSREQPWDRSLHTKLLNKLAGDNCPLVVMDIFFGKAGNPPVDNGLAAAMARLSNVVLAAEQSSIAEPHLASVGPTLPQLDFLLAARTNWGVAWIDPDPDLIVRRHWPYPSPGPNPSLPWKVAELCGARLSENAEERWLRYYDPRKAWSSLSYHVALAKGPNYFRDKVVFIGTKPRTPLPDNERDEFRSPHFNWTGETVGGVEVLITSYFNLMNGDWLRRLPPLVEGLLFLVVGAFLGGSLIRFHRRRASVIAAGAALVFIIAGVSLSDVTNYWFPWLILVGGQVPCALAWAWLPGKLEVGLPIMSKPPPVEQPKAEAPKANKTIMLSFPEDPLPDAPEYELLTPHIGKGAFGKVWIARNAIGQWQALKAVYAANFGDNRGPYEAEFKGLQRYKPVSEKHPGLLRIELISRMKPEDYFYYVMELGDAQVPGWERQPSLYKPKDLENMRKQVPERRFPAAECLRIVTLLADALDFLHKQGLTHRDIKPANVIFVNGRPKLADVGLVADIRPLDQMHTMVGTFGYMPPMPEQPGTVQADIYALGMLLFVISTGRDPTAFTDLSTTLMERSGHAEFVPVKSIILKACHPNQAERYQAASEMVNDLRIAGKGMGCDGSGEAADGLNL